MVDASHLSSVENKNVTVTSRQCIAWMPASGDSLSVGYEAPCTKITGVATYVIRHVIQSQQYAHRFTLKYDTTTDIGHHAS
jgi:hypothetical protein